MATTFLIACPARTGSSMLVTLLTSHPDICCHGEVFGPRVFETFRGISYSGPITETHKPPIVDKLVELRKNDPVSFLREFVFFPGDYKAIGLKFKYEELSLPFYSSILQWIVQNRDINIIHLTRRNLLKRYVSQVIATKKTKVFNIWDPKHAPPRTRVTLSPEDCEREFEFTEGRYKRFAEYFQDHDVFDLTYETLVANKSGTLTELQRFLGVRPTELNSGMKKINPDSLRELLNNFDELKEHFRGTRFAVFFE